MKRVVRVDDSKLQAVMAAKRMDAREELANARITSELNEHFDADQSAFIIRELTHIKAGLYDVKYAQLKARQWIPIDTSAGPGAEQIVYASRDFAGRAVIIDQYSEEIPLITTSKQEFRAYVKTIALAYDFTDKELQSAAMAKSPLDDFKATSTKRLMAEEENDIALFGDPSSQLKGFFNHSNVPSSTILGDGTGSSKKWNKKTTDKVLRDMHQATNGVVNTSKAVEIPDTMLLPLSVFNYIMQTRYGDYESDTIMTVFLKNTKYIKNIDWSNLLETGNTARTGTRGMVSTRDPKKVTLEIPEDFTQKPPQYKDFKIKINCKSQIAGVIFYYPYSAIYFDGI